MLVHDFVFSELIACIDSTKFIFNLIMDSLVPFMGSYFQVRALLRACVSRCRARCSLLELVYRVIVAVNMCGVDVRQHLKLAVHKARTILGQSAERVITGPENHAPIHKVAGWGRQYL